MAEALRSNSSLASLNLNSNQLGEEAGRALAEAPKSNSSMANLDLFTTSWAKRRAWPWQRRSRATPA